MERWGGVGLGGVLWRVYVLYRPHALGFRNKRLDTTIIITLMTHPHGALAPWYGQTAGLMDCGRFNLITHYGVISRSFLNI